MVYVGEQKFSGHLGIKLKRLNKRKTSKNGQLSFFLDFEGLVQILSLTSTPKETILKLKPVIWLLD